MTNNLAVSGSFLRRKFSDQRHVRISAWHDLIKDTQRDRHVPLFTDREEELRSFFRLSKSDLWTLYLSRGFPNSKRYRDFLDGFFEGRTDRLNLKSAYDQASFYYAVRLMLAFERYTTFTPYLERLFPLVGAHRTFAGTRVLEYGCGVSDIGLLCNLLGARVTICDIADKKLEFAMWRHKIRGHEVATIPIQDTEEIPDLGEDRYDLIIATEIFEHVRDPFRLLAAFTRSLRPSGVLFDSMGGTFAREVRGDHLAEALAIGNSDPYRSFYERHYRQPYKGEGLSFLFIRR